MRTHKNQTVHNGQIVKEEIIAWSIEDYDDAISFETGEELESLLNEKAFLIGQSAMAERIDYVADQKRMEFLGDTTRAFEYQAAELGAKQYRDQGFTGEVPNVVQSWADATGMTTQQAAENILGEALVYNTALNVIRSIRLNAKQAIKNAETKEQVQATYFDAIAELRSIG